MRRNMTMKATRGIIGAIVLMAAGCTVKNSTGGGADTLVANAHETVPFGTCVAVEGPYSVVSGTDFEYSVINTYNDDFDVGIDTGGCDLTYAYSVAAGNDVANGDIVPAGSYYLEISCQTNGGLPCQPLLDYWTAN